MNDTNTGRTIKILGRDYPVWLVEGDYACAARFRVYLSEDKVNWFQADSFRELEDKAREIKDGRFRLELTSPQGHDYAVTGFHAGNGNALVEYIRSGKKAQESWYRLHDSMPRLNDKERKEFLALLQAREDARDAVSRFVKDRALEDVQAAANVARAREAGITA